MDTIKTDREILKQVLLHYAQLRPSHGDIRLEPVFDQQTDRYALMQVGWDRGRRVRGNLVYVTIKQGKIWIEYDGMEGGIADELIRQGISPESIMFAFLPESQAVVAG